MALADLISRLEREARSNVEAIALRADTEIQTMTAATDQAVADTIAHSVDSERMTRRLGWQHELAHARREAFARELRARHAQLARILDRARALIPEMAASRAYRHALPAHLEETLQFLDGLQPRVRCRAAFGPLLQETAARHGATLVSDESVGPGIVAEAADGSVIIDNTLAARLERLETALTIELARKLTDGN